MRYIIDIDEADMDMLIHEVGERSTAIDQQRRNFQHNYGEHHVFTMRAVVRTNAVDRIVVALHNARREAKAQVTIESSR